MPDQGRLIGYKLLHNATLIDLEILKGDMRPNGMTCMIGPQ
jgi:hypothetical protein